MTRFIHKLMFHAVKPAFGGAEYVRRRKGGLLNCRFTRATNKTILVIFLVTACAVQSLHAQSVDSAKSLRACLVNNAKENDQWTSVNIGAAVSCFSEQLHWTPEPLNPKGPYFPRVLIEEDAKPANAAIELAVLAGFHQMFDEHKSALALLETARSVASDPLNNATNLPALLAIRIAHSHVGIGDIDSAREALKHAATVNSTNTLISKQLIDAEKHDILGYIQAQAGDWRQAESSRRSAIATVNKLGENSNSIALAEYQNNLGIALLFQNHFVESETLLKNSWNSRTALLPAYHPALAESKSNLSTFYFKQGRFAKSLEHNESASRIYEKNFSLSHRKNIEMASNRATILAALGRPDQSVVILDAQCGVIREKFGKIHSLYSTCLHNRGSQQARLGNLDAALQDLTAALEILNNLYPNPHPSTANTLDNLGLVYGSLGNRASQTEFLGKALALRRSLPELHEAEVAFSLHNLGYSAAQRADYLTAKSLLSKALEIRTATFDSNHPDVVLTRTNLGFVLLQLSDASGGLELQLDALQGLLDSERYSPVDMAVVLNNLGLTVAALDEPDAAEEYFLQALALLSNRNAPELLGHVQYNLGSHLRAEGSLNLAIFLQKQAVNSVLNTHQMLDEQHRLAYLRSNDTLFKHLAKWLIEDQRIDEANDVLDLLDEYQTDQSFERNSSSLLLYISEAENRLREQFSDFRNNLSGRLNTLFETDEQHESFNSEKSGWLFSPDTASSMHKAWEKLKTKLPKKKY